MKSILVYLRYGTFFFFFLIPALAIAQEAIIEFPSTSAPLSNPERGWYDQYSSHSGGSTLGTVYKSLKATELRNNREKDGITLILRLFYLHEFLEQNSVSEDYLGKMQADFDSVRAAGIKCIVRFAYSASQSAKVWDATPDKVFTHIASLRDVLGANSDVIAGVQAGFIGAWGEWYYTKNFAGNGYVPDATDQLNRITLFESLLNIFPENIVVEGRTPAIMKNVAKSTDPISDAEAYDGSFKSRIGHHNDCFVASASDYGTYTNLENDLAYLGQTTKYTITGGETCDASNSYSDCSNSVSRMALLHWTYMNRGYNQKVYDKWKEQKCYDEVSLSLGYRINLVQAVLPVNGDPGDILSLSFVFQNHGYAAPTQEKPVQIVLVNTLTGIRTDLQYSGTHSDIRFWLPGEILLEGSVTIPLSLPDGNYKMYLRFPDLSKSLADNPAYSIQLANPGIWEPVTGMNALCHIITIGSGGEGSLPAIPGHPEATTVSESEIALVWTDQSDGETGFEIMRSEGNSNTWEKLTVTGPDMESYQDTNLKRGTFYNYMIRSLNTYGYSAWSDSARAATVGVSVQYEKTDYPGIFPNPLGQGNLTLQFKDDSEKLIRIYKYTGETVFEILAMSTDLEISRELLEPGIYVVCIQQDNVGMNRRLIVL